MAPHDMAQADDPKADPRFDALRDSLRGERPRAAGTWGYFTLGDGARAFMEQWLPQGPPSRVVLCFHGMAAHGRVFAILADALVPRDTGVVACDMRGHGLSDGTRGDIADPRRLVADARQVYAAVRAQVPTTPLFTLGESLGGALNANLLMAGPRGLRGAVFVAPAIAPVLRPPGPQALLIPAYALAAILAPRARIVAISGQEHRGSDNTLHVAYDRNDPLHLKTACMRYMRGAKRLMDTARDQAPETVRGPALVFQGGSDAAVRPDVTKNFFDALRTRDKTLKFYEHGKHCLMTDRVHGPLVFSSLIHWLEQH